MHDPYKVTWRDIPLGIVLTAYWVIVIFCMIPVWALMMLWRKLNPLPPPVFPESKPFECAPVPDSWKPHHNPPTRDK
jgi:hypothetical protein